MHDQCSIPRCRRPGTLIYTTDLTGPHEIIVCEIHWNLHCDPLDPFTLASRKRREAPGSPNPRGSDS